MKNVLKNTAIKNSPSTIGMGVVGINPTIRRIKVVIKKPASFRRIVFFLPILSMSNAVSNKLPIKTAEIIANYSAPCKLNLEQTRSNY